MHCICDEKTTVNNQFGTETWAHKITLDRFPIKREDINVKMENELKTLSVSGESEVNTDDKNGVKIFSVHNWQKKIPVPENLDLTTLTCKMEKNWVVFTAEFNKEETPDFELWDSSPWDENPWNWLSRPMPIPVREEKTEETEIPIKFFDFLNDDF